TIEQIRHVLKGMPAGTDVELRNRAVVAFTLLTGARDAAIASLKLKHVDILGNKVEQDAREVRTKFSKTFTTWFFPVGDAIRQIVVDWVGYLTEEKLYGPVTDPQPASLPRRLPTPAGPPAAAGHDRGWHRPRPFRAAIAAVLRSLPAPARSQRLPSVDLP